jgi:hypothetical protein
LQVWGPWVFYSFHARVTIRRIATAARLYVKSLLAIPTIRHGSRIGQEANRYEAAWDRTFQPRPQHRQRGHDTDTTATGGTNATGGTLRLRRLHRVDVARGNERTGFIFQLSTFSKNSASFRLKEVILTEFDVAMVLNPCGSDEDVKSSHCAYIVNWLTSKAIATLCWFGLR